MKATDKINKGDIGSSKLHFNSLMGAFINGKPGEIPGRKATASKR